MSLERVLPHGVMEDKGAYNKHAKIPAGGASLAVPLLEKAVRFVELDTSDQAIVIADYGSSQGETRWSPCRPRSKVCGNASAQIARSACSISTNRQTYAAVWLSRIPALVPGHFFPRHATEGVRKEFDRQAAKDWEAFLSLRARELRIGGRLIVVLPGLADDWSSGVEHLMHEANAALGDMVADGSITSEERARMVLGSYPRRKPELLAPFARDGHFHNLSVEDIEMFELSDAAWAEYEQDGNKEAMATKHALFFRSIFMPSLASALDRVRSGDAEALRVFGDRVEAGLKQRLASEPRAMHSVVQAIVLSKQG